MNLSVNHNIALLIAEKTSSPVILTDAKQQIEWVNSAFTQISGYTLKEIKGKRPEFLHGEETSKEVINRIQDKLSKGEICKEEMMNYAKDGSTYWVALDILPVIDEKNTITHFLAVEQDITEKKEHEKLIKESEQKLRAIYDSTRERNVLINTDLQIMAFNQVVANDAEKFFGKKMKEGDLITDYLFTEERNNSLHKSVNEVIKTKKELLKEVSVIYPDNSHHWYSMTYYPVYENNELIGISLNLVDITDRKRAENKIIEQNFQLREIARMQSHEVRRPLSNILGLSYIMENHDVSDDKHKYILDKLKESADELDKVVHKIVNSTIDDDIISKN